MRRRTMFPPFPPTPPARCASSTSRQGVSQSARGKTDDPGPPPALALLCAWGIYMMWGSADTRLSIARTASATRG